MQQPWLREIHPQCTSSSGHELVQQFHREAAAKSREIARGNGVTNEVVSLRSDGEEYTSRNRITVPEDRSLGDFHIPQPSSPTAVTFGDREAPGGPGDVLFRHYKLFRFEMGQMELPWPSSSGLACARLLPNRTAGYLCQNSFRSNS